MAIELEFMNGNCIHRKEENGFEQWCEYDEQKRLRHRLSNDGNEYWYRYNEDGTTSIHYKFLDEYESWRDYYPNAKLKSSHIKWTHHTSVIESWVEYNENGTMISYREINDKEEYITEYDEKGNEIHHKNSNGFEKWYTYDELERKIHYKESTGYEEKYEYGKTIKVICKYPDGKESINEIDDDGEILHIKNNNGHEEWYYYNKDGDVTEIKESEELEDTL